MKQSKQNEIESLEAQIREKDRKISHLEAQVANYRMKFEDMQKASESIPVDCTPGEYCKACAFSKSYFFRDRCGDLEKVHFCGKAGTCKNFVQREDE